MNNLKTSNNTFSQKTAAILAFLLGLVSVFAGSKVLLEIDSKDYNVLIWLVSYNVVFGAISIIVAYLIWKNYSKTKSFALFVLAIHFMVFIYLKFVSETAALESVKAMLFRTSVWVLIVVLLLVIPKYLNKTNKI